MDSIITKKEFAERNQNIGVTMDSIEEEISRLNKKAEKEIDYLTSINHIKEYFTNMYLPEKEMTKEQVDEMVKVLINRINVTPVDKTKMDLEIILNTSQKSSITYDKKLCCSDITFKKMIPKQQFDFPRCNRRACGHAVNYTYCVYPCFIV